MTNSKPLDVSCEITAEDGRVVRIEGADGRARAYTVEEAVEMAARLLTAAAEAGARQLAQG
ncbi:MAG TPA: hypothetical protein VGD66_04330 [Allosphingosinicella sp.]